MTNIIKIWAPKFSTQEVLIAPYHVQPGINKVVFTKTRYGALLMDGAKIKSYPMVFNGKIGVHAVPIKDFEHEDSKQLSMEVV